jgi:quercetin dioxygenase-like cupin family protein
MVIMFKVSLAAVILCAAWCPTGPAFFATPAKAHVAFSHSLPALDGAHLKATVVEVTYEPGGSSPPHHHPCAVIGYVLEGAVRMKVNDQQETIYKVGESFYEAPNDAHRVSANASQKERARFLAYFTCDRDAPLSIPGTEK